MPGTDDGTKVEQTELPGKKDGKKKNGVMENAFRQTYGKRLVPLPPAVPGTLVTSAAGTSAFGVIVTPAGLVNIAGTDAERVPPPQLAPRVPSPLLAPPAKKAKKANDDAKEAFSRRTFRSQSPVM